MPRFLLPDQAPRRGGRRLRLQTAAERMAPDDARPQVRFFMMLRGMTFKDLAAETGAELQTIRDIASGRVSRVAAPFLAALPRVAEVLEVGMDELYPPDWLAWAERRLLGEAPNPLRRARLYAGLSVGELAAKAGMEFGHISRLERDEVPWRDPGRVRHGLRRIAAVLGTEADVLFGHVHAGLRPTLPLAGRPETVSLPPGWPDLWSWRAALGWSRKGLAAEAGMELANLRRLELGAPIDVSQTRLKVNLRSLARVLRRKIAEVATTDVLEACRKLRAKRARVKKKA